MILLPAAASGHSLSSTKTTKNAAVASSSSSSLSNNVSVQTTLIQRLVAGGLSRAIAQMILYPVDALRTLAQTRDGRTLADVGSTALLRGCITTSSFALFTGAIQFGSYGTLRHAGVNPLFASAVGAAASCLISVPQEVLKQRMVTGVYSSFGKACREIYIGGGLWGFYSAWRPTVARNVPFVVSTFTSMDYFKRRLSISKRKKQQQQQQKQGASVEDLTALENFFVGISSALVAVLVTNPFDVIKTRMMTQAASSQVPYSSAMDCFTTILKTEGIRTFYSGIVQRSLYMGPLWAIQFALNGQFTKAFQKQTAYSEK